jgi:hypothetical protein
MNSFWMVSIARSEEEEEEKKTSKNCQISIFGFQCLSINLEG